MLPLIAVVAAGIVAGLATGGSIRRLGEVRLRWIPAVFAGVALQIGAALVGKPRALAVALVLGSYAAVFAFAAANFRRAGMLLLALGALMNVTVVAANGGMPVSRAALGRAGLADPFTPRARSDGFHHAAGPGTRIEFLADVIPLPAVRQVVSAGDLVLWAGLLLLVRGLTIGRRGRRSSHIGANGDDALQ